MTESTLGHQSMEANADKTVSLQDHYRITCFLPVMDRLINEMERHFGDDTTIRVRVGRERMGTPFPFFLYNGNVVPVVFSVYSNC